MRWLLAVLLLASGAGQAATLFDDDSILKMTLEGLVPTAINDIAERHADPFTLTVDDAGWLGLRISVPDRKYRLGGQGDWQRVLLPYR